MGRDIYRMVTAPKFVRVESAKEKITSAVSSGPEDMYDLDMLDHDEAWEINEKSDLQGFRDNDYSGDAQYEKCVWTDQNLQNETVADGGSEKFDAGMFVGILAKARKVPDVGGDRHLCGGCKQDLTTF